MLAIWTHFQLFLANFLLYMRINGHISRCSWILMLKFEFLMVCFLLDYEFWCWLHEDVIKNGFSDAKFRNLGASGGMGQISNGSISKTVCNMLDYICAKFVWFITLHWMCHLQCRSSMSHDNNSHDNLFHVFSSLCQCLVSPLHCSTSLTELVHAARCYLVSVTAQDIKREWAIVITC